MRGAYLVFVRHRGRELKLRFVGCLRYTFSVFKAKWLFNIYLADNRGCEVARRWLWEGSCPQSCHVRHSLTAFKNVAFYHNTFKAMQFTESAKRHIY